jgi:hypothetical protein
MTKLLWFKRFNCFGKLTYRELTIDPSIANVQVAWKPTQSWALCIHNAGRVWPSSQM